MQLRLLSHSPSETEALGEELGRILEGGEILALCGELGSGKTTFVRGLARGLGVGKEIVVSPSFTLLNEYPGRINLYHFDFYRLEGLEDLESIGFWDYIGEGIVTVEWADRIPEAIPEDALWITFSIVDGNHREISLRGERGKGRGLVEGLMARGYNLGC